MISRVSSLDRGRGHVRLIRASPESPVCTPNRMNRTESRPSPGSALPPLRSTHATRARVVLMRVSAAKPGTIVRFRFSFFRVRWQLWVTWNPSGMQRRRKDAGCTSLPIEAPLIDDMIPRIERCTAQVELNAHFECVRVRINSVGVFIDLLV